jgi:ADP-heptose:LPS heptosyltransferase
VKAKLLIVELWGLGDLVIATPFLRAASEKYDITLLAKPYALDLQPRLWPKVKTSPFNAPWTAFQKKYHVWRWPLREMFRVRQSLAAEHFDCGFSARYWDPRDYLLMMLIGIKERIGFPSLGSRFFLTRPLPPLDPALHRYESWRAAGKVLDIELPSREELPVPPPKNVETIVLHSGARLPARIWPLENWRKLALDLRKKNYTVQVACDADQESWWKAHGENDVACARTVSALFSVIDGARLLVGNCSGPGHLAAICGVPTFTIFGPSLTEWFAPLHPQAEWIEGKACPYKPCSDYCHFSRPFCIQDVTEEEVLPHVEQFIRKHSGINGSQAVKEESALVMGKPVFS